jgi:hypothetical protein
MLRNFISTSIILFIRPWICRGRLVPIGGVEYRSFIQEVIDHIRADNYNYALLVGIRC